MPQDNVPAFIADPVLFIAAHPIVLNYLAEDMGRIPGGLPIINNQRSRFTLSTATTMSGSPGPNDFPALRMQPDGSPVVVRGLNTLDAMYCHAGKGGMSFDALPYCDIPVTPGAGDVHLLFTTGMNGCSLIIASAVSPTAPALALGRWRVMHDYSHRSLAAWAAAGYTLRFASYAESNEPGPVPPGMVPAPIVNSYNPHNYPWNYPKPPLPAGLSRVVTNFLYWDGTHWTFNSRHFHVDNTLAYDIDKPASGGMSSTQTVRL